MTPNQQQRITNIELIEGGASVIGLIAGVVYSKRTGGGALRGIGWGLAGMVGATLITRLATTPFKNRILKENEIK